jgi:hypothetical protein
MVVLNAPRSFIADDGLVHLFTYLFVYAVLGCLSPPPFHTVVAVLTHLGLVCACLVCVRCVCARYRNPPNLWRRVLCPPRAEQGIVRVRTGEASGSHGINVL